MEACDLVLCSRDAALYDESGVVCDHGLVDDKRKLSLLNVDFKVMTGLEAKRHRKIMTRTVSHLQLVAGADRRIHHGIALARDAIHAAGKSRSGCGILDTDLIAAFDWMVMDWVKLVLAKKGMCEEAIARISNLYSESLSIVVVNNVPGRAINNQALHQAG